MNHDNNWGYVLKIRSGNHLSCPVPQKNNQKKQMKMNDTQQNLKKFRNYPSAVKQGFRLDLIKAF